MINQVALLGEAGSAPSPHARGPAPQVSAAGVTDASALARQQLLSAVPAASLVAAYHAAIVHPPQKPLPRITLTQPSSALAAQLLAQDQLTSAEDLALFTPHPTMPPTPPPAENSYLQDLRIARGEVPAKQPAENQPHLPTTPATPMPMAATILLPHISPGSLRLARAYLKAPAQNTASNTP